MLNNDLRTLVIPFSVPVNRIPHWVLKVPHFEQHPGVMGTCHLKTAAACMVACEVESAPVLLSILKVSAALAIGLDLALETRLGTSVENLKADRSVCCQRLFVHLRDVMQSLAKNAQSACYCLEVHPVKLQDKSIPFPLDRL